MTIERDNIPELNIELMDDSMGSLILLEQDSSGNIDRVCIHPVHLRYMAEKFGLVSTADPQATKTVATLTRRIHLLRVRAEFLASHLATDSESKQAAPSFAQNYARATADIANEFCAELVDTIAPASANSEPQVVAQPSLI